VRGVGPACAVALVCAACAASGAGKAAEPPVARAPGVVPRVAAACALPSVERCRRIETLVRWEHEQAQALAHLGATIVDTYDHPPLTIVFETGTNRWRSYDQWPPRETESRSLYLQEKGGLAFTPPNLAPEPFDAYVSDPRKPVPYTAQIRTSEGNLYTIEDQRFARSRPDVLVYQTEPLADDVTISGPIRAVLDVSTTGTDADWVAKVIDVYPSDAPAPMGGYQPPYRPQPSSRASGVHSARLRAPLGPMMAMRLGSTSGNSQIRKTGEARVNRSLLKLSERSRWVSRRRKPRGPP